MIDSLQVLITLFVERQEHGKGRLCKNDMSGVGGNVELTDISDIGCPGAMRGQALFHRKIRKLKIF
jgi:hypothetical protein